MTAAARYAIVRFLPYAETEEFANVGVLLHAPEAGVFAFRLVEKWRRVGAFFNTLDRRVFTTARKEFEGELLRLQQAVRATPAWGRQAFDDVTRPRESMFRFSAPRAVLTDDAEATLDALFGKYVEHAFATPEYQEDLLDRTLRTVFRREGLVERYRKARLGTDVLHFPVPFAATGDDGRVLRVVKPLHLAQDDPVRLLDHGNQWIGRLRHLERQQIRPAMLFPVQQPAPAADNIDAFMEIRQGLEEVGAEVVPIADEAAILRFARAA